MGKVVEFLARVGSDASLRHGSADTVDTALRDAGVDDDDLRRAVGAKDGDALRTLFGQRGNLVTQMPIGPEHEETEDPLDDEDDDGDGKPDEAVSHVPSPDPSR
ncbi:MAG TPA: hypothetical protein VN813_10635 [Luteibacter sp.]|jgi:hypothetical protein|nr:hypothetical protein [Luteibacter sp.]